MTSTTASERTDITELWNDFNDGLKAFICKKVNNQDYCNDIMQEVYIKAMGNIDRIKNAGNTRSYLFRMAANAVADHFRSDSKTIFVPDAPENEETFNLTDEEERSVLELADCCLRPMIESLPSKYREALILTELEGLSQKQLAERLNISFSGAKSRVQRGREQLKTMILGCCNYKLDRYGNILNCGSDCS